MDPITSSVLAKLGADAPEVLKKESAEFLSATLGPPAKAFGGLVADWINSRRHSNLIKITVGAKRKLVEAGLSPQEVPLSIIHPALEAGSREENPDLQELWANLLANAADPRQNLAVLPSFAGILKELTSRDVKYLSAVYQDAQKQAMLRTADLVDIKYDEDIFLRIYARAGLSRQPELVNVSAQLWRDRIGEFKADFSEFRTTIDTAVRHQILSETQIPMPIDLSDYLDPRNRPSDMLQLRVVKESSFTHLGASFLAACQGPKATQE